MPRILVAGFIEANLANTMPVLDRLRQGGWKITYVPGLDYFEDRVPRHRDHLRAADDRIVAVPRDAGPGGLLPESSDRSPSECDPATSTLTVRRQRLLHGEFGAIARAELSGIQALASRLLGDERPDVLLVPEDTDAVRGRAWSFLAASYGVPCIAQWPSWYNLFGRYPLVGRRYAGHYVVFGEVAARRLASAGVPTGHTTRAGSPWFEEYRRTSAPSIARGRCVVFATQALSETPYYLHETAKAASLIQGLSLVVKVHPEERPDAYVALLSDIGALARTRVVHDQAIRPLVRESHGVLSASSTATFEALCDGIQAVLLRYPVGTDSIGDLGVDAPARVARGPGELTAHLAALAQDEPPPGWDRREEFLESWLGPNDGDAVTRIVGAVERAAERRT